MTLTAESTSQFVMAGRINVHYHEAGEGPVLVCIHGGAPGAFGWGNFGRNMEALSQHFRTLIIDLPGYGKSAKPQIEGDRTAFYADVIKDMLDALGISKVHLAGLAGGGGAALKLAIDYPEYVDRLVIISSAGSLSTFSPNPTEGQKVIWQYFQPPGPSPEKMREYLTMMMYDQALITPELVQERYEASVAPDFVGAIPEGRFDARVVHAPLWQELDKVKAQTLVIWGRDNRVQGYDNALFFLQRIPDVEVHIYGKCGLWVPWEKADAFNRLVTTFLEAD